MSTTVDDETILEVLRSNDAPRMTTTEVAGKLPVTRGTTRTRLQRLVDDGRLERKTEGNYVVWWLPERADELDAWEADREREADEPAVAAEETEVEADEAEADDEPAETETTDEEPAEPEPDDEAAADDDTAVEVEATDQADAKSDEGETAVEVEAVDDDIDEVNVRTPDEETETRTADSSPAEETVAGSAAARQPPELSEDEEGLRALALLAAAVVLILLLRKLVGSDEEPT